MGAETVVCEKNTPPEKSGSLEHELSEHGIGGRRAVSATGTAGQGLVQRELFVSPTGMGRSCIQHTTYGVSTDGVTANFMFLTEGLFGHPS